MHDGNIEIEDRILLKKAASEGCCKSLCKIYIKYMPSLLTYLRNKAPHLVIAEDITQEVFQQILEGRCRYDGSSDPLSYIIGVGKILLKKDLKENKYVIPPSMPKDYHDLFTDNDSENPIGKLSRSEFRHFLHAEMSRLSFKLRQAVELVYVEGKTYTEAAKISGCSYDTMRMRTKDALAKLKTKIFPSL